jgi:hypothetical protein
MREGNSMQPGGADDVQSTSLALITSMIHVLRVSLELEILYSLMMSITLGINEIFIHEHPSFLFFVILAGKDKAGQCVA